VDISGIDLSPHMLAVYRQRLAEEPKAVQERARAFQADMRHFDLGRRFRLVTIPFRAFQHLLTAADELSCLASIHRHLVDDGTLHPGPVQSFTGCAGQPADRGGIRGEPPFSRPDGREVRRCHKIVAHDRFNQVT
jgi:hypothetical protein